MVDFSSGVEHHVVETKAFEELIEPKLLKSGYALAPYKLKMHRLIPYQDETKKVLVQYREQPSKVIQYAIYVMSRCENFKRDIEEIAQHVQTLIRGVDEVAIIGAQANNWLFSGPVANILGLPHIGILHPFLGEETACPWEIPMQIKNGNYHKWNGPLTTKKYEGIMLFDILARGTSIFNTDTRQTQRGWKVSLESRNVQLNHVVGVSSSMLGGERHLHKQGVSSSALIHIDDAFFDLYANSPHTCKRFKANPVQWTQEYLLAHGTDVLLPYCNPKGDVGFEEHLMKKFFSNYGDFFEQHPHLLKDLLTKARKAFPQICNNPAPNFDLSL